MLPISCQLVSKAALLGKDQESKKIIRRLNAVDALYCDLNKRISASKTYLKVYCNPSSSSSSFSSSSSSSECLAKCKKIEEKIAYLISVPDLNEDVYDSIILLEQEACALYRKLLNFEALAPLNCNSSSSSIASPSSSSSEGSDIPCNQAQESGGQGTTEIIVNLGTATGTVYLDFDAYSVPDKFIVEWGIAEVINTGYRGDPAYDGTLFDLVGENTSGTGSGFASFVKNTAYPTTAKVTVTAPLEGTAWVFTLGCPGGASPSSSSSSPPSSSSSSSPPSSSSSSSAAPSCLQEAYLFSSCEFFPNRSLYPHGDAGIGYGPCSFTTLAGSSSSSSGDPSIIVRYNEVISTWEIYRADLGVIATMISGNAYSPLGAYTFIGEFCGGSIIYLV